MIRTFVVSAQALLWVVPLAAQSTTSELQFPIYPLGPSVVALGGASVARPHDAAGSLNPATLLMSPWISVYHYEGFADYAGDLAAVSVRSRRASVGVSLRRFGWDRIIEDDLGVAAQDLRTGESQYAFTLAVALTNSLQFGAMASRLVTENLGVRISASSWSLGAIVAYASDGYFGLALLNAGRPAHGSGGNRYDLPTRVRAGLTQKVLHAWTVSVDGEWPPHASANWSAHAGIAWQAPALLVIRAGLESLATPGAVEREFRIAGGFGLLVGPLEVSLASRFGGIAGSQEWFIGLDAFQPGAVRARRP